MTYSSLTDEYLPVYGKSYSPRAYGISKVTVHHMAGDLTIEDCQRVFNVPSRQASSNYGIGSDGRIGCYVPEEDAAWTSFSYWNDNQAITIEVADYDTDAWSPSKAAYESTVLLCADICNRYGIEPTYTGGTDGSFTEHMMYQSTACPGPWWHDKLASGSFIKDVKNAMEGRLGVPMECILHPDECGTLFYVCGTDIVPLGHPDQMNAVDMLGDKCGTEIPHVEMGTKSAPWGWRFFQACGKGDLYEEVVEGKEPAQPAQPIQGDSAQIVKDLMAAIGKAFSSLA